MKQEQNLFSESDFPPLGKNVDIKENTQSHYTRVPLTPKKTGFSDPNRNGSGVYSMPNTNELQISPYKINNGFQLYFSQNTVSSKTSNKVELNNLANQMNQSGWPKGMPSIKAAIIGDKIVVYDHRRLVAGIAAGIRVPVEISNDHVPMILKRMEENGLTHPRSMIPVISSDQEIFTGENKKRFDLANEHLSKRKVNLSELFVNKTTKTKRTLRFTSGKSGTSPATENAKPGVPKFPR